MSIRSLRGNREISSDHLPVSEMARTGKTRVIAGDVRREKSDSLIVAAKQANNPKGRSHGAKEPGNAEQPHMRRTQSRKACHRGCHACGSCEAAEERTVYSIVPPADSRSTGSRIPLLSRKAAAGVDGIRVDGLRRKHEEQHNRSAPEATSGQLQAQPGRRHYIPKADGKQRPLGIASLEDKIVQYALVKILNAVYENDFMGFSYGFRPGRSQHDALDALQGWYALT